MIKPNLTFSQAGQTDVHLAQTYVDNSQGGDLVPSLPLGVSEIWMEMGTFTSQTGADGV